MGVKLAWLAGTTHIPTSQTSRHTLVRTRNELAWQCGGKLIGCGVCPPYSDVSTQGQYQMMDEGFVGLIVSCFVQDAAKRGQVLLPLVALHPQHSRLTHTLPAGSSHCIPVAA